MITVSIFRKKKQIKAFELSGHAESGPYGFDLVCAAVSAVSFGTVNAIDALCKIELEIKQGEEGYLYVSLPHNITPDSKEKAVLLIEGMVISLQSIEREYNQFVRIKTE